MTANNSAKAQTAEDFIISRTFDAPRELVWKACTEPERLQEWFGPKGFKGRAVKMEFRPGGRYLFCLESPEGQEMWGRFVYREITPPERIVYVHSFSDENGGLTRHPLNPVWPIEILSTFTFAEHDGKTTFTIHWSPLNPSEEEIAAFNAGHASMNQGWGGTMERLEEYLAKAQS